MNNPLRILQTFDRHLAKPTEITLFGRAALALGYAPSPIAFAATHDVDAILPLSWLEAEDENLDFWEAQQRTNAASIRATQGPGSGKGSRVSRPATVHFAWRGRPHYGQNGYRAKSSNWGLQISGTGR
jgi:hypothetical protein